MSMESRSFLGLCVDDDPEQLDQLKKVLPSQVMDYSIIWEFTEHFTKAKQLLETRKYDLVVCDIYVNLPEGERIEAPLEDASGFHLFLKYMARFSLPWVLVSNATAPEGLDEHEGPFLKYVYKPDGPKMLEAAIKDVLSSGIPEVRRSLIEAIEAGTAGYIWGFLKEHLGELQKDPLEKKELLERVIRNRAAVSLGRIDPDQGKEVEDAHPVEFYFYPPIAPGNQYRLGSIIRAYENGESRVVLNPHCHLAVQQGKSEPRAELVVTVGTALAGELIDMEKDARNLLAGAASKRPGKLARLIRPDFEIGSPNGRFWFLPGLFDILPNLFCAFLDIQSIPKKAVEKHFEHIATLAPPFAENFQACFQKFFGSVGIANLNAENFMHLYPKDTITKKKT